jgi:hypothetical protein
VRVESAGERALISGDLLHHPCQIAHPDWPSGPDIDPALAVTTRKAALEGVADKPVLFIVAHFAAPTAGHVRRAGETYRFEV